MTSKSPLFYGCFLSGYQHVIGFSIGVATISEITSCNVITKKTKAY